jgi:hypothetical protein
MLWLAVTALLAQSPTPARVVVLPAARPDVYPHTKGILLASRITAVLNAQGLATAMDAYRAAEALQKKALPGPETCSGNRECLAALARALGVDVIVSVDAGEVREDLAIHVEALRASDGRRLTKHGFVIRVRATDVELGRALGTFVENLKPLLAELSAAAPPVVAVDIPLAEKPVVNPPVAHEPVVLLPEPQVSATREQVPRVALATAGATGLTALAAGGFLVAGLAQQNRLNASFENGSSTLTLSQAQTLRNQANSLYTASALTAVVTCALAVTTALLWTARPGS